MLISSAESISCHGIRCYHVPVHDYCVYLIKKFDILIGKMCGDLAIQVQKSQIFSRFFVGLL